MKKEILILGIICLFIGVGIAPGITANNSLIKNKIQLAPKKETVSFTIEPCGLNSEKQTVELTKEEAEIIKQLFNSIRERLNETETREEAEEVFKEAVVELDKYGLIGDLSIEKAQRLVTGEIGFNLHEKLKSNKYYDLVFDKLKNFNSKQGNDENRNCLIVGRTTETFFHGPILTIISIMYRNLYEIILALINILGLWFFQLFPIPIGYTFCLGWSYEYNGYYGDIESTGWVYTNGDYGIKKWNGEFFGNLPMKPFIFIFLDYPHYPAVTGFSGIKYLIGPDPLFSYYFGFASHVKIGDNPP